MIYAINTQGRANRAEERREDDAKRFREYVTIILIASTLLAISWQVYEMVRVYGPISDQADASKKFASVTSEAQRAWVGPTDASIDKAPAKVGDEVRATVLYQNSGREPARSFFTTDPPDMFAISDQEDADGTASKRIDRDIFSCLAMKPPIAAQVVYPTTGFSSYNRIMTLPKEAIDQEVVSGTKSVVIEGCFVYLTSGAIHHSTWCYFFRTGTTQIAHLNICRFGNYAD